MKTSALQQAIESVESLPIEDQEILLDILQNDYKNADELTYTKKLAKSNKNLPQEM